MSKDILGLVEQLVSKFDAGQPVDSILQEINSTPDSVRSWVYELDLDLQDFLLLVHQDVLFMVNADDEDIFDSYDRDFLLNLDADGIKRFTSEQLEWCCSCDDQPSIHFYQASQNSMLTVFAEPMGHAMHYYNMQISHSRDERINQVIDEGFVFAPQGDDVYPDQLLVEKYKQLIVQRFQ